ncbi:uncharacterized protein Dwil_GK12721 [Drosophila willistoni]|uniref:Uncharacterized protein n=1 Tax=Drosophila willistoni TaxID=7260 RepID=B4N3E7_DROWI|nr:uncharacterized protein Dwil_GK12721 [Drosophila willistoni]
MATTALADFREIECVRWFRGLSVEQIRACDRLLNALRDDTEQGTTYRVRFCFSQLGLHPPVPSKRLEAIMKISHCNDLAFLWFIWEAEYKQPRNKGSSMNSMDVDNEFFTVNEQLLFSAMAHLDMAATLRALDRILPPPAHSKKKFNHEQNNHVYLGEKEFRNQTYGKSQPYLSPYFAPLVRPKQFVPMRKLVPEFEKLEFPEYSHYKDPMYEIPNEKSRWFSQYELSPGKRIIKKLLTQELDRLFFDGDSVSSEPDNALCNTHRSMEEEMALKKKELTDEALHKCLAQLDVVGSEKQARRKRIIESLEKEIQCAADKMHQFSRRQFTQLTMLRSDGINSDCRLCQYLVSSPPPKRGRKADLSVLMHGYIDQIDHLLPSKEEDTPYVKVLELRGERKSRSCCDKTDCTMVETETLRRNSGKSSQTSLINRSLAGGGKATKADHRKKRKTIKKASLATKKPTTNFKNLQDLIPVCGLWKKCTYQNCHNDHPQESYTTNCKSGIQLDYFKIFDPPELPPLSSQEMDCDLGEFRIDIEDKQPLIERYCVDALNKTFNDEDDEQQKWESTQSSENPKYPLSVLNAIDRCAINMFKQEKAIRDRMQETEVEVTEVNSENLLHITNIDPDNRNEMVELLKSALKILQRDPRYVLATFSNAHKLPILVDWVANRYGKTYNRRGMEQIVNSSFSVCEQLDRMRRNPLGKLIRTDIRGVVSYDGHARIMHKAHCMKMNYNRQLNDNELEHSRLIWLALHGYSHLSGYIGDTFFAYMPSRDMDLRRHNVWKSSDYRDMVETRVRLRHQK